MRVQAVEAVKYLQFTEEGQQDDDCVTKELMRAMKSDSSPEIRQAALAAVHKTVPMLDEVRVKYHIEHKTRC